MEALCPDCAEFGAGAMSGAIENLREYFLLEVYPYGNTKYNEGNGTYTCQHGPDECYLDLVQNCLIYMMGDNTVDFYPFIKCSGKELLKESHARAHKQTEGERARPRVFSIFGFAHSISLFAPPKKKQTRS